MRLIVLLVIVISVAACTGVEEPPQVTATSQILSPDRVQLLADRYYGGQFPAWPDDAFALDHQLVREEAHRADQPTIFYLKFTVPATVNKADVEIRAYFERPVSIIGYDRSKGMAFHNWGTNTNMTVWMVDLVPGDYVFEVDIQDYFQPTTPAPEIFRLDAFYRPR